MKYLKDLETNGYCVIKGVYEFGEGIHEGDILKEQILLWIEKAKIPYATHGVLKHHEVGQQPFQWNTRCKPEVQEPFKQIFKTEELVCSFDGIGYVPKNGVRRDNFWMHTDQAPNSIGFKSVQGIVALTSNKINSFMCIPGSHLFHQKYFENRKITGPKASQNWYRLENSQDYETHTGQTYRKVLVPLEAGDLLIFDSRLFHQNNQGGSEERLVQYVTFSPRSGMKKTQSEKRHKYFQDRRTTSHWPYPVRVNSLQPQHYGDLTKVIDYANLPKIDMRQFIRFGDYSINDIYNLI